MEDFYFCEKMMYFDYECIFECIVYVWGFVVYGEFELYDFLSEYIKVKFL